MRWNLALAALALPAFIASGASAQNPNSDWSLGGGTGIGRHATGFSGTISGFGIPGGIDLRDIAFATATLGYSGDTTSGILTVQDASSSTAHIHLLGNYTLGSFKTQDDGQGGTLVTDPPVVDPSSLFNPHP